MGTSSSIKRQRNVVSQKDPHRINILFVCDEWKSSKGGLSTFNRESAIYLAKTSSNKIKVHCYVSQSDNADITDARKNGVNIITAQSIPVTSDRLEWLRLPPPELSHPDIVIGHGRKFGTPAYCIVETTNCKWVQVVHVYYEDLGKYKLTHGMSDAIEENAKKHEEEIKLCKAANAVVAVGSRLQQKYSRCLPDTEIHVITPGILDKFTNLSDKKLGKVTHSPEEFSIFVIGRASYEDLALKGYDIIADAVGFLGEKFKMTFVGSPKGEFKNIEKWLLKETRITQRQVTIRGYCDQDELKRMFNEADLVAMPSRTEGFGLIALEAISSAIPVLVTSESGIAEALTKVDGGKSVIVDPEDTKEWSQKIRLLSEQKPEERHNTAVHLRENYKKTFSWITQCEQFSELILRMMEKSCAADHDKGMKNAINLL